MRKALLFILACLCSLQLYAQWSGETNINGAYTFARNNNEDAVFKLKYQGEKHYLGTSLSGGHDYRRTTKETSITDLKTAGKEYAKYEDNELVPRKWKINGSLLFGYRFNDRNSLDMDFGYRHDGSHDTPELLSERYHYSGSAIITQKGMQSDTNSMHNNGLNGTISYMHRMLSRKNGTISVVANVLYNNQNENKARRLNGELYTKNKNYRTHGNFKDLYYKIVASYNDVFHLYDNDLKTSLGLEYDNTHDYDKYRTSNNAGGVWRDSTWFHQSFYYYTYRAEPYIDLTYSIGKFDFHLSERVQWYIHSLENELEGENKLLDNTDSFTKNDWKNFTEFQMGFHSTENSTFKLEFSHSITRPEYKKLCAMITLGASEGEYFIGNPNLVPETINDIKLRYSYNKGIFVAGVDLGYSSKHNTAEKVLDTDTPVYVEDPDIKTIYTWVNTQRQQTLSMKLSLDINSKDLSAKLWTIVREDYYHYKAKDPKTDYSYDLGMTLAANLNEKTVLSADMLYLSAKESAYNEKGEDMIANVRLTRKVNERLSIYVEEHDIADKDLLEVTWNEQMTYSKTINTKSRNYSLVLGLSYKF